LGYLRSTGDTMKKSELNSYDVLAWWGKVLHSCNTEDQFKNALNMWPRVIELTPCVNDAWLPVVCAARNKLRRIVTLPTLKMPIPHGRFGTMHQRVYPNTALECQRAVFGLGKPIGPPCTDLKGDPL